VTAAPVTTDVRVIQGVVRFWRRRKWLALLILLAAALVLVLASGVYTVPTNQTAALFSFGRLVRDDVGAGLHFKWPAPIQSVKVMNTSEMRSFSLSEETSFLVPMITGDENLIEVDVTVQYQVSDYRRYLTGCENWEQIMARTIMSVMTELVAERPIDDPQSGVLTTGKSEIQQYLTERAGRRLDEYGAGLRILSTRIAGINPPVEAAASFRQVSDAKTEKAKRMTQARSAAQKALSEARGQREKLLKQAAAEANERVKKAEGDADRFLALKREYEQAREATRTDQYLRRLADALSRAKVLLYSPGAALDINLFNRRAEDLPSPGEGRISPQK